MFEDKYTVEILTWELVGKITNEIDRNLGLDINI